MSPLIRYLRFAVLGLTIHPRRPRRKSSGRGPARSWRYLAWVRSLPCLICGGKAEAAHTGSDGGMRLKASDYSCVPLCHGCHRGGNDSYHQLGRESFERVHQVDLAAIVRRLNHDWFAYSKEVK